MRAFVTLIFSTRASIIEKCKELDMPEKKRQSKRNTSGSTTATKKKKCKKASTNKEISERQQRILEIRKSLAQQKEQLLQEAGSALNTLPDENAFPDMGDQATAEIDRNFMLRLRGREQRLLKKIELAMERIDNGTYGICEICGCEIGIKRLEARPVTTMCIECKTEQEEEEKIIES